MASVVVAVNSHLNIGARGSTTYPGELDRILWDVTRNPPGKRTWLTRPDLAETACKCCGRLDQTARPHRAGDLHPPFQAIQSAFPERRDPGRSAFPQAVDGSQELVRAPRRHIRRFARCGTPQGPPECRADSSRHRGLGFR